MVQKKAPFKEEFTPILITILRGGYSWKWLKSDLIAGISVGVVALTLSMAFAIASGVSPEKGIYTSIIGGFLIAILGGSRFQIGGPTAAFITILYTIVQKRGYEGLIFSTLFAGAILLIAAFSRVGKLIKYIPLPLIVGFTSGISVIIFSSQIKDFFGLQIEKIPSSFIAKWEGLIHAFSTWDPTTTLISLGTLFLIIVVRRFFSMIPWMTLSVILMTAISYGLHLPISTIASYFGEIPSTLPSFFMPSLTYFHWDSCVRDGFTIAFLAGMESLLTALLADGLSATRHKSNCELMAQGFANIACGLFQGISATGMVAGTAMNVKAGAQTPMAAIFHTIVLICILSFFAPIVSQIPLCVLSSILIVVAWDMSQIHLFRRLFKAALDDIAILLTAFLLTIFLDLTVAVEIGMTLSAFFIMKRMGDQCKIDPSKNIVSIPKEIVVYDIFGPFFFGVTDQLHSLLSELKEIPKIFVLRLDKVPFIDVTGMQALKDFLLNCEKLQIKLYLSGVEKSLMNSLEKFEVVEFFGEETIFPDFDQALKQAEKFIYKK